jgi:site-specific DNA-methyltransferase (adenine-specific)
MVFMENTLYYGDNLEVLRKHIKSDSIDLIYLDPPFNSQATYNILFKETSTDAVGGGYEKSKAQIQAFTDSWTWDTEAQKQFEYLTTNKEVQAKITDLIIALEHLLGKNSMSAYLVMMTVRLIEMRRVLKPTGSLYLHCDPTASHYLKLVLDSIFGEQNFRNEIIWHYGQRMMHNNKIWNAKHDTIFFYAKTNETKLNITTMPWTREEIVKARARKIQVDENGKEFIWDNRSISHGIPPKKQYIEDIIEKGKAIDDVWNIPIILSTSKERLGYPTQKPIALLERIILASSDANSIILDPFCGCGTTIDAVEKVNAETHSNRKWIGIDITHLAINLIKRRIADKYHKLPNVDFEVIGEPKDLKGAEDLAQNDRYQFEWWALSLVDARPINDKKKGSDRGIDGIIYLLDPNSQTTKTVLVQVKSGHVKSGDIRDFKGTLEREKAKFGIFITLEEPTKDMKEEAITYGFEEAPISHEQIQKIQILTIKELLDGVRPKVLFVNISYKKAEKNKEKKPAKVKKQGKYKKLTE